MPKAKDKGEAKTPKTLTEILAEEDAELAGGSDSADGPAADTIAALESLVADFQAQVAALEATVANDAATIAALREQLAAAHGDAVAPKPGEVLHGSRLVRSTMDPRRW